MKEYRGQTGGEKENGAVIAFLGAAAFLIVSFLILIGLLYLFKFK